jgi:hypothetical protein
VTRGGAGTRPGSRSGAIPMNLDGIRPTEVEIDCARKQKGSAWAVNGDWWSCGCPNLFCSTRLVMYIYNTKDIVWGTH